jgi:hypothetical protein
MRDDELSPQIRNAIEQQVAAAFEALELTAAQVGQRHARLPYLDEPYEPECETLIPYLKQVVCRALAARKWFEQHAPPGAPELPLSSADIEKMIGSKSNRIVLVGYFAASLAASNWDYHLHP